MRTCPRSRMRVGGVFFACSKTCSEMSSVNPTRAPVSPSQPHQCPSQPQSTPPGPQSAPVSPSHLRCSAHLSSAARQGGSGGGRTRVLLRRAGWTGAGCTDVTNRFFSSLCSLLLLDMQAPIWMVETFDVQSGQCLRLSDMAALGFRASTTKRTGSFLRRYRPGITVGIFEYGRGDWGG